MGSALSSLDAAATDILLPAAPKQFTVVMVGLDGSGTTSILNRLCQVDLPVGELPATVPTIAPNCRTILHGPHSISVIDLGGQEGVRDLWRMSYCEGHAFIFAVDASAPHRFGPAKDELHWMCTEWQCADFPLLVLANKTDLARAVELDQISRALDVEKLSRKRKSPILVKGVSALNGKGLKEALDWVRPAPSAILIARLTAQKAVFLRNTPFLAFTAIAPTGLSYTASSPDILDSTRRIDLASAEYMHANPVSLRDVTLRSRPSAAFANTVMASSRTN
ncbi:ADP-ribosylation factor family-domain-containing protein [Mycena pura]|uniref:ADP-ribosylation factor family-domain-containing protein n=1 Tax=Mycena pura TaxID=153505 RepID=A0AAD6XXC7_9AGAR|nr:ADP-ribosylation factor family-domain-containing protein [Mycena pura]